MKRFRNILWGLVLVAAGTILTLNTFEVTNIDIFFDGWWTLFIIVPCFIGLFRERDKTGNFIGLFIGVTLLLCCQDVITFTQLRKLIFPIILILIGISLIFKNIIDRKIAGEIKEMTSSINASNEYYAIFSGQTANYVDEEFTGASFIALFGGGKCDLRQAIINDDHVINCTAIFGGIDILLPGDVQVKVKSTSIFGGVSKKKSLNNNIGPTIYVNATCIFGGVNVK